MESQPDEDPDNNLQQAQLALQHLTLLVTSLSEWREQERTHRNNLTEPAQAQPSRVPSRPAEPQVGDRVPFWIGIILSQGTVVGVTQHRVRIQQDRSNAVLLRAPQNINVIHDRSATAGATVTGRHW
jgi:hypothetical protein